MSPASRPFRRLCPQADYLDSLTEAEYWERVASSLLGNDMTPDYEPEPPDLGPEIDGRGNRIGVVVISDHVSPCPICHEWGACGYDAEGRPLIHALYDEGE